MKGLLGRVRWGYVVLVLFVLFFWRAVYLTGQLIHQNAASADNLVAVPGDSVEYGVSYKELNQDLGITTCYNGHMSSFIRTGLDDVLRADVTAHELKHQEQAGRFANDCDRFHAWYETPAGMLSAEAEAFMAGLCVNQALGGDGVALRQDYADRLSQYFGGDVNRLTIVETMRKYDTCPIGDNLAKPTASVMPGWMNAIPKR